MIPGELIGNLGDTHLYLNHIEQVKLQLTREPKSLPDFKINPDKKDIFSFEFVKGSAENSLQQPGTAVLTEKTARRYFGDENAIGKIFNVSNEYDYTVVGVIEDIPQNSHFTFDLFFSN